MRELTEQELVAISGGTLAGAAAGALIGGVAGSYFGASIGAAIGSIGGILGPEVGIPTTAVGFAFGKAFGDDVGQYVGTLIGEVVSNYLATDNHTNDDIGPTYTQPMDNQLMTDLNSNSSGVYGSTGDSLGFSGAYGYVTGHIGTGWEGGYGACWGS